MEEYVDIKGCQRLRELLERKEAFVAEAYDLAVIGAGHAGIEAAMAASKLASRVILFSISLDAVANLPCNPNIGGTAKGQLVREIDALGGVMGEVADEACIQFRMLNASKGPAVHSPRAQVDRSLYHSLMKERLEKRETLSLRQSEIIDIFFEDEPKPGEKPAILGVLSKTRAFYPCRSLVIACGTYLRSRVFIGDVVYESGPDNHFPARELSAAIERCGHRLRRFKTGTPVRVKRSSIDLECLECQAEDELDRFMSYRYTYEMGTGDAKPPRQSGASLPCYVTFSNHRTHDIIRENIERSPLFSGLIEATGTRYCPSIEDKVVKFAEKERHQIFVEPVGVHNQEMYLSGLSSSMPEDVQLAFLRTLPGFEKADVERIGYAIEYDLIDASELGLDLQSSKIAGLFFAGQINGSSGYEEAGGQGLIAGINAHQFLNHKAPLVLDRAEAYIGVLIDDLVTKGTNEPYRMMTARAEYRLLLRQDNADLRLSAKAHEIGLIDEARYSQVEAKRKQIEAEIKRLKGVRVSPDPQCQELLSRLGAGQLHEATRLYELLKRPKLSYAESAPLDPERPVLPRYVQEAVDIEIRYEGYIRLEAERINRFKELESQSLSRDIDYSQISGLRLEARQKLNAIRPQSIGQASRISGVSPADISVLLIYLETKDRKKAQMD
ncbi:MAG: tRNA uridine-5-carboxymethylaminomethyl(34) synthesis enzyme MnmG [Eubacteriales bacterium]|nr:tRNA uridine-5-carboxymethylaminomethyl(34) synthesis enzyme MnmG [Eubacteriales bacterium]